MKDLIELAKIVTKKKIAKVEILDEAVLKDSSSLYGEFYEGLVNEQFKTDEDAAQYFYNATPLDDRYRKLKSRIRKRLLNHLYYLDINQSSYSDYRTAYVTCYKNWSLVKLLLVNSARNTFEKVAKQTINQAIKFNFTDLVVLLANRLSYHYSYSGDLKNYSNYRDILKENLKLLNAEIEIEQLYHDVLVRTTVKSTYSEETKELAKNNCKRVREICSKFDSHNTNYYNFIIHCIYAQITMDHPLLIEYCDKAEAYFEEHPEFYQQEVLAIFAVFKISAFLQLRDYQNGNQNAEKCFKYFSPGANNWFLFLEYYFLLSMHTGNYLKAAEIFSTAVKHPRFKMTSKIRKEKWKIFEGFLNYIFESEKIESDFLTNEDINNFKLYKFLNEVPTYTKDKSGYNVAILVLQILYLLEKEDFDGIIDKAESLRMYSQRHLKKQENPRSYYFIKMLRKMEQYSFDYEKTIQGTDNLLRKLRTEKNEVSEWEIIPYEKLWEKVLLKLEEEYV